ncbi:MAG: RNA-splicing ligase RtcB [Phycisphaerae bacterium]|nr:RNA-splicing ligase RtcB [Phycisphaerae bacterium]
MPDNYTGPLERLDDCRWRIPRSYKPGMRVDGLIYADDRLIDAIRGDRSPEQVANVAMLPGIVRYSLAMPDIHWGYGFCIGGVAATDPEQGGVISPGGVGYDINCGVRLIRTDLSLAEARPRLTVLIDRLFATVPAGVGHGGRVHFDKREMRRLLQSGSRFVIEQGYGWDADLAVTEAHGRLDGAEPDDVSDRALERGHDQCGTLGSGNHFMEVQVVDEVHDEHAAAVMGLQAGNVCVMIHSGSRGLGYQVCEDYLKLLHRVPEKYGIELPDRQLVCAPVHSPEGQRYLGAMRAAANFAWSNRQIMTHLAREAFESVFETPADRLGMHLVYDVAHNIAKMEPYNVREQGAGSREQEETRRIRAATVRERGTEGGNEETESPNQCESPHVGDPGVRVLCVHRKGATRAFPPGHPELPEKYCSIGQPVLVPGDMGRCSWVLVGQPASMEQTFGSSCHGAGRRMSRTAAIRASAGRDIHRELLARGVYARARGRTGLEEEQPDAYKDVSQVVDVLHAAAVSRKVAKLRPVGVIKG